jgi:hypothetical protein
MARLTDFHRQHRRRSVLSSSARARRRPTTLIAPVDASEAPRPACCPAPRLLATFPRAAVGAAAARPRRSSPRPRHHRQSTQGEANCTPVPHVALARPHIAAGEPSRRRRGHGCESKGLVARKLNLVLL